MRLAGLRRAVAKLREAAGGRHRSQCRHDDGPVFIFDDPAVGPGPVPHCPVCNWPTVIAHGPYKQGWDLRARQVAMAKTDARLAMIENPIYRMPPAPAALATTMPSSR